MLGTYVARMLSVTMSRGKGDFKSLRDGVGWANRQSIARRGEPIEGLYSCIHCLSRSSTFP